MAKRKTAMASEPKSKPPTGGGYKAKPNVPVQRLSPGVYRSASGGLVSKTGRSLEPRYPSGMAQRIAAVMQPQNKGLAPLPLGMEQQAIQGASQGAPVPPGSEQFVSQPIAGPQGQMPQEMLQGLPSNKMGHFAPGQNQQQFLGAAQQQPMPYQEPFLGPMLSGYRPPLSPPQMPMNPQWNSMTPNQMQEQLRYRGR